MFWILLTAYSINIVFNLFTEPTRINAIAGWVCAIMMPPSMLCALLTEASRRESRSSISKSNCSSLFSRFRSSRFISGHCPCCTQVACMVHDPSCSLFCVGDAAKVFITADARERIPPVRHLYIPIVLGGTRSRASEMCPHKE